MTQASNPPKGYFKYILAIDCETTGYNRDHDDPSQGHQAVSWGIIVADAETLLPVEKLYVEIKWNDESKRAKARDAEFGVAASAIHGLTFDYLEEHGMDEAEAAVLIANLIIKYWGPTVQIKLLGHNVHLFDLAFFRAMFRRHNIELPFGSRHYDTNSLGFLVTRSYTSDQLFDAMGLEERKFHNSMEDIEHTLESARRIRILWDDFVGITAHD